jgi:hypothetical protein
MTIRYRVALTACASMLVLPFSPSHAAEPVSNVDLSGVKSLRVTASPMSVEAMDCNLESSSLVRNLEHHLNAKGISTESGNDTVATITVLSTHESERCSSAVMVGAYRKASFFDHDAGWLRTGHVVLWQSGLLVTSSPENHPDNVSSALEQLTGGLVEDWRYANRGLSQP